VNTWHTKKMSEKAGRGQTQSQGSQQKQPRQARTGQQPAPARAPSNPRVQMDLPHKRKQATKKQIVQLKAATKEVALFSHLPQFEKPASVSLMAKSGESIHPAIVTYVPFFPN
jgi:hypothetical protein